MKSIDRNGISTSIRLLRKEKKLKQADLADKLSVKQSTVSRWENGIDKPSIEHIIKLVETFGCTFDELHQGFISENPEEHELLINYRRLSKIKKLKLMQLFRETLEVQDNYDKKRYAQNEVDILFYLLFNRGLTKGELKLILFDQIEKLEIFNEEKIHYSHSSKKTEGQDTSIVRSRTKKLSGFFSRKSTTHKSK